WHNDEAYARFDALKADTLAFADTLKGQSHPLIKAKCFDYVLTHAPLYLNTDDPFGITPEALKMSNLIDTGAHYEKILNSLTWKWQAELGDRLNFPEDREFVAATRNYLFNEFYIDYNHSTPCWEDLHALGYAGILERARKYRASFGDAITKEQADYFDGIEYTYEAILRFFDRVIAALEQETGRFAPVMLAAMQNLRHNPPATTYEALLMGWLFWCIEENIDCMRARTMGGIDVLFYDFVARDRAAGMRDEEIKELFAYFMLAFHSYRVAYQQPMYLGGMDEAGNCTVNDLSYLLLDAYNLVSAPNPKLQAKISANTPDAFVDAVCDTIRRGNSSISIINDDNACAAMLKLGCTLEEARTTLMSGCWDFTIKNKEVKTIPIRASLPKILEYTMTDGICLKTGMRVLPAEGRVPETYAEFEEAFRRRFLQIFARARNIVENWEKYLEVISPSNMYSATHVSSLEHAVDGYARGMKYNTTIYTVAGLASLVDGLSAIRRFVYTEKRLTVPEFVEVLKANFEGHEALRRDILNDADKYGNGSAFADDLAVRLCKFFAESVNGQPNGRDSVCGRGFWKLGTLSIHMNVRFGVITGATPDGRLAGEPFSKNMSSVIGMDRGGITTVLNSVAKIDFTDFPHAGMVDVILHPTAVSGADGLVAFRSLVRTYFKMGGHSIQFNVFDAALLKKAQAEPMKYRNLQVRVCGWNVYFVELSKIQQDDFIAEAEHNEAVGL
ncbi:MAG: hypothetical protein J6C52_06030, partial [Clostridia bacterium]|nr:hypothetical protein [Clostridia bacterium]